jgi:hypothetical protein
MTVRAKHPLDGSGRARLVFDLQHMHDPSFPWKSVPVSRWRTAVMIAVMMAVRMAVRMTDKV